MKVLIVHLSDIHIKGLLDPIIQRAEEIASSVFKQHIEADMTCLVISGDIAFSGKADEYEAALKFVNQIVMALRAQKPSAIQVIAAPGNHDCDFSRSSYPRIAVIESLSRGGAEQIDEAAVAVCTSVQDEFFAFLERLPGNSKLQGFERLQWDINVACGQRLLRFRVLNVAWMSTLKERYGRLHFPPSVLLKGAARSTNELQLLVFHHPLNWFQQGNMHDLRSEIRRAADFVLTGHEHSQNAAVIDDALSSETGVLEGGALSSGDSPSTFGVIEVDLDAEQFRATLFENGNGNYIAKEVAPSWASYRALPSKRQAQFEISDEFQKVLSDPGAKFTHPIKGDLFLDDIYVFPDLREHSEGDEARRISSKTLLGKGAAQRALLVGEEKAGKTSLLYQLFKGYYDQGLVPIYLPGVDIAGTTDRDLDAAIARAFRREYGSLGADELWKLKTADRALLIDDYDRIRGNERLRHRIIAYANARFDRVYLTTTDALQLEEYLIGDAAETLRDFRTFSLLQLGHKLRYQLIKKWTCGGGESTMPLSQMTESIDRCERILNNVLGRGFVPAIPLFLLTLLQSVEATSQTDLTQSAFGQYYSYLVTRGLRAANVRKEELDEIFNYCAYFAHQLEVLQKREMQADEFDRFNAWFSQTFTPVSRERRTAQLLDAGILARHFDGMGFKYPYFRYYFLGKFYAEELRNRDKADATMEQIRQRCRALHLRENANVVLFLIHHTKEPFVFEEIVSVLRSLFKEKTPMRFEGDVTQLGALIDSASRTVVEDWDVEKNRENLRDLQDEVEERHPKDGSIERDIKNGVEVQARAQRRNADLEVSAATRATNPDFERAASLVGQVNTLFKTIELLGQILKSYYGSLTIEHKREYIRDVLDGALRALADFFEFLSHGTDALVTEIEAEIARTRSDVPATERQQVAREAVFNVIGMISYAFVSKAADAVNAATLRSLVRELVEKDPSAAKKIIELASILDSAEEMPIGRLKDVCEQTKGNIFAQKLVETSVFQHLYMFPTSVQEKQKIQDLLDLDMRGMRAIDLKSKQTKFLKEKPSSNS